MNNLKDKIKQEINLPNIRMRFEDAPTGARFNFCGETYVKINCHGSGLIAKWEGNVVGRQSFCCWIDKENGYDFNTIIELI